ncbi:rhamnulokinase [Rosistilla oblonga]|uniref:rhamnulokinase n=1 Tax=Rosistilla oblonga TaxID=2527990 RepID=UPI003A97BFB8
MASAPVHLAVDLGASSGRVLAGCIEGGQLKLSELHRFANDPVHVQGRMYWNLLGLWQEIRKGLSLAAAGEAKVLSVGVDTWGVDYVCLDANGDLIGPGYHYRDARTRGMFPKAFERVAREEIFAETGLQFMELNTAYQMLAARLENSPVLDIANQMLMIPDFFHWLLTGKAAIEYTNATTTQLYNTQQQGWSQKLLKAFDLPTRIFSDVVQPGTVLGPILGGQGGVPGLEGVPVVLPATHDTGSAVVAVPADNFAPAQPDWCYISSGTWSLMGCEIPEPLINDRCAELNFTNEGGVQGSTRLLKNIGGLWIFQQIKASLERRGQTLDWPSMVQAAADAKPFQLLIDPDCPDFAAPACMVDAIAVFANRTGQPAAADNGVLFRGALEGLALRYRTCLGWLESLTGTTINTIHILGGGAQNALLCQMTADACRRRVLAGPVEATAIGNIVMQMVGLGQIGSIQEGRQLIRDSFQPVVYEPQDPDPWDAAAERFEKLDA